MKILEAQINVLDEDGEEGKKEEQQNNCYLFTAYNYPVITAYSISNPEIGNPKHWLSGQYSITRHPQAADSTVGKQQTLNPGRVYRK